MKREIQPFDYADHICKAFKKGILLTTKDGEFVNTMTIGWGTMGVIWGRPVFIAYVRESRHTKTMLEKLGEFTVNIPYEKETGNILGVCGTKSGRDVDKIKELNLHLEEPMNISVPGIQELPLTLECKVIYKQKQDLSAIPQDIIDRYYPETPGMTYGGESMDYHICYYGQIVGAYLIGNE